jgi:hypothetical protein
MATEVLATVSVLWESSGINIPSSKIEFLESIMRKRLDGKPTEEQRQR